MEDFSDGELTDLSEVATPGKAPTPGPVHRSPSPVPAPRRSSIRNCTASLRVDVATPHITLPDRRASQTTTEPPIPVSARARRQKAGEHPAREAQNAKEAELAAAASARKRNRKSSKRVQQQQQKQQQAEEEEEAEEKQGKFDTPPPSTRIRLKLKRVSAPVSRSPGEGEPQDDYEDDDEEEQQKQSPPVYSTKKRKVSPQPAAQESGDDYNHDDDDDERVKVLVKAKRSTRRMKKQRGLLLSDEEDDEQDRSARNENDEDSDDAVSNLSSELSDEDFAASRHKKASHRDKAKSGKFSSKPSSSKFAESSSHVAKRKVVVADDDMDAAPVQSKKPKSAGLPKSRSSGQATIIPLPRKAGASLESSTAAQSSSASAQAALKKHVPRKSNPAAGMAMFDSIMKFAPGSGAGTPTIAAKAAQTKPRPPSAKPPAPPGAVKPTTAAAQVRPLPRPLGYVSAGTSSNRSGVSAPTGAHRSSLQTPKHGANGEHVSPEEMAEQREIEAHRNANPMELFDLLADQETVIEWEEECKRQARADPQNSKIIRPTRPEGVAFLVAKIKHQRAQIAGGATKELEGRRVQGVGTSAAVSVSKMRQ